MVRLLATTALVAVALLSGEANAQSCQGTVQRQNNGSDFCNPAAVRTAIGAGTGTGTVTSVGAGEGLTTSLGSFGGSLTTSGMLYPVVQINAQTGTTYTVQNSDCGKMITYNNAAAVAVTLPQAGAAGSFLAGCKIWHMNIGAGNVTVTPTTSTIDELPSRVLQRYGGMHTVSNGTNYFSGGIAPAVAANGIIDPDQLPTATDTTKGGIIAGTCITMGGTGNKTASVSAICRTMTINFAIDGGGSAITTGIKGTIEIPAACTITAVRLRADQTGSVTLTIKKAAYNGSMSSIVASAKPTLSSAQWSQDTTLTGWTTAVSGGDWLEYTVDTVATITYLNASLTCVRTGS